MLLKSLPVCHELVPLATRLNASPELVLSLWHLVAPNHTHAPSPRRGGPLGEET